MARRRQLQREAFRCNRRTYTTIAPISARPITRTPPSAVARLIITWLRSSTMAMKASPRLKSVPPCRARCHHNSPVRTLVALAWPAALRSAAAIHRLRFRGGHLEHLRRVSVCLCLCAGQHQLRHPRPRFERTEYGSLGQSWCDDPRDIDRRLAQRLHADFLCNGASYQWRSSTGGSSDNIAQSGIAAPYWCD